MQASAGSPGSAYVGDPSKLDTYQRFPQESGFMAGDGGGPVGTAAAAAALAAVSEAAAAAEAEEMGAGTGGCEYVEDEGSDMSDPWIECDEAVESDVITSAFATWCAHEEAAKAKPDPLASFFAQLVSLHTLADRGREGPSNPSAIQANPTPEEEGPKGDASCPSVELEAKEWDVVEPQQQPRAEECGARHVHTPCTGGTVADTLDPESRAFIAASLKRNDFPHILGSLRAAILSSPEIFGFYDVEGPSEADGAAGKPSGGAPPARSGAPLSDGHGQQAATDLQQQNRQQQQQSTAVAAASAQATEKGDKRADDLRPSGDRDGADSLLPPAVSVNSDFCKLNPRVAARWLVHSQMESLLGSGQLQQQQRQQQQPQQQQLTVGERPGARLDGATCAQLACLVPPKALCSQPEALANPARDQMHVAAARLAMGLSSEQMHALKDLLQAWYFSGFFAGQLYKTGSCS
ncbi:hypothetical protein, conserved [Eimeria brunetti]|uniref:Uncharacterized protein n=1 Tax=Eimeria brunetti TaxID=51314 RepID=U6LIQ3_9EIME|nr:hypothetical protein, conserved [Eimeria brunetti]